MKIIIEPHNPAWVYEFNLIKQDLQNLFKEVPIQSIQHVGSTSIPGLLAKPIIDIDVVITPENLCGASAALVKAGYTALGDQGVPSRYAFRQPRIRETCREYGSNGTREEIKRNTYVVLDGSIALRNHLDLKRMLLENEVLRNEYGEVKRKLVNDGVMNMAEYCRGKNEVILKILKLSGWNEQDLKEVLRANSWWWAAWRIGVKLISENIELLFKIFGRKHGGGKSKD